ncbi:MAG: c-type cytochrome [Bacteroidota bacterium]
MASFIHMNRLNIVILGLLLTGCTYYENESIKIPEPEVPNPTTTLEASYVTAIPNKITSSYWKTADYLPITAQNQITGQVPAEDGLFNMSGTLNGLTDFNLGEDPTILLKAAYSNDSLYILISWKDASYNASQSNWFYDGPTDSNKPGSTAGWTSQQSDDNLNLSFDMGSGKSDIWNWSLALSEPLGYAIDKIDNGSGAIADAGNKTYVRNAVGDNRSGPKYDWDGVQQELQRKPAGFTILDPGYYLLNKKDFVGDVINGEAIYQFECSGCHGVTGDGEGTINPVGIRLNIPGQFNRWTQQALDAFASDPGQHEGAVHYPSGETEREDLFTRLRGFSGIPGYILQNPSGSNSDVHAVSNIQLAKIEGNNTKGYSVLLIRAMSTGSADDIVFSPSIKPVHDFNISFMDNDMLNRIGSINKQLTFKPKP